MLNFIIKIPLVKRFGYNDFNLDIPSSPCENKIIIIIIIIKRKQQFPRHFREFIRHENFPKKQPPGNCLGTSNLSKRLVLTSTH